MSDKPFKIYRSSAGSGKTFTLVRTYLSLLLKSPSDTYFKQVLAVTFTNKAADEMKQRVLKALKDLRDRSDESLMQNYIGYTGIGPDALQEKSGRLLTAILHNYGDFNILTIDKFIHRIIRSFSKELGLNSSFDVESDTQTFLQKSIDALLDQLGRKGNEAITGFLESYYESMLLEGQKSDIEKSLMDLKNLFFSEESKDDIEQLQSYDISWFEDTEKEIQKRLKTSYEHLFAQLKEVVTVMNSAGLSPSDFSGGIGRSWGNFVTRTLESSTTNEIYLPDSKKQESLINQIEKGSYYKKGDAAVFASIQEPLENHMVASLNGIEEIEALNYILKGFHVYSLIGAISKKVKELKGSDNLVFLSEFNQLITSIVVNEPAPFIYERIGTRFTNFLVDEFQDTSKLQWQNLVPLFFNSLGEGNENLIVGDDKQAIYRWRGGNVEQFIQLPKVKGDFIYLNEINTVFETSSYPDVLNDNWRSSPEVVTFNNELFTQLKSDFSSEVINAVYKDKNVIQYPKSTKKGYVNIQVYLNDDDKRLSSAEFKEIALCTIENQINDCIEDGFNYGDIAILIRTKKEGIAIIEKLKEIDVPFVSSDAVTLLNSADANFVVSILSLLSEEESILTYAHTLKFISSESKYTELFDKYRIPKTDKEAFTETIAIDLLLNEQATDFNKLHFSQLNLYAKVNYIIQQFNLSAYNPYIDAFFSMVLSFEQQNGSNELAFIDYFNQKSGDVTVNLGLMNRVQIMTIHKSKGLEFPVVLMPFCSWEDSNPSIANYSWVHSSFVDDLKLPNYAAKMSNSLSSKVSGNLMEKENEATILDNINLYYVAFTRPVYRLYAQFSFTNRNSVTNSIIDYIQTKSEGNVLEIGKRTEIHNSIDEPDTKLKGVEFVDWTEKLSISVEQEALNQLIDSNKLLLSDRQIGIRVHDLLSKINSLAELDDVLSLILLTGEIDENQLLNIKAIVSQVFELETYTSFLTDSIEVLSELEIIDEVGNVHRPDKVFELENEVVVVDFKIGQPNKKYEKQLRTYIELLLEIYSKPVVGYLLFADSAHAELIEVKLNANE